MILYRLHEFLIKILAILILSTCSIGSYAAGVCTGFFISSDGYIATAGHCHGNQITAVYTDSSGKRQQKSTVILGTDHSIDVMLLKIDDHNLNFFPISNKIYNGEHIRVYGYPEPDKFGWNLKTTDGTVTGTDSDGIYFHVLIAPGNSGGPIVDDNNNVIGEVTEGFSLVRGPTMSGYGRKMLDYTVLESEDHIYFSNKGLTSSSNASKVVLLLIDWNQ